MNAGLLKLVRFASVLCLAVWAAGPRAAAQTPAGLDLQLYVGLTVTGAVGTVYQIQHVTDLAQTNTHSAWRCLEFLQLPATPYVWADKSAAATGQRFYRAVMFPAPTNMVFIPPGTFRMGSNPSYFTGDSNRPVEQVSWFDSTNYCAALTERERLAERIATNSVYRLPTEAEWEYACECERKKAPRSGREIFTGRIGLDPRLEKVPGGHFSWTWTWGDIEMMKGPSLWNRRRDLPLGSPLSE